MRYITNRPLDSEHSYVYGEPLPYGLATLQLSACNLPVAPAGEPADQNNDTMPQGSPNRALLFATTPIISFCKPTQLR